MIIFESGHVNFKLLNSPGSTKVSLIFSLSIFSSLFYNPCLKFVTIPQQYRLQAFTSCVLPLHPKFVVKVSLDFNI